MGKAPKVYFAGKVSRECYRTKLLNNSRAMSYVDATYDTPKGKIQYNGPYALGCDHGCLHNLAHGGVGSTTNNGNTTWGYCEGSAGWLDGGHFQPGATTSRCLMQIRECDFVIAYIDTLDCFGTIAEIGIASAFYKNTFLFINKELWNIGFDKNGSWGDVYNPIQHGEVKTYDDLWFIKNLPHVTPTPGFPTFSVIPSGFFPKQKTHKEKYHEYLLSEKWASLRIKKIAEAGGKCQMCNKNVSLQVHHRTYDNIFNEKLSDLIVLCKYCHKKFHNIGHD